MSRRVRRGRESRQDCGKRKIFKILRRFVVHRNIRTVAAAGTLGDLAAIVIWGKSKAPGDSAEVRGAADGEIVNASAAGIDDGELFEGRGVEVWRCDLGTEILGQVVAVKKV